MKQISENTYVADQYKTFYLKDGDTLIGKRLTLDKDDSIENYEERDIPNKKQIQSLTITRKRYEQLVEKLIRKHYTASEEFAILRQKDTKPDEYDEYFSYCEECKKKAKNTLKL